jgi:hypothetical protein
MPTIATASPAKADIRRILARLPFRSKQASFQKDRTEALSRETG